jgi:hypothetical protein
MPRAQMLGIALLVLRLVWADGKLAHASEGVPAATAPVAAAPSPLTRPTPAPAERRTSWYGYQIVLADAASIGLGLLLESPEVLIAGYLAGPVIIHGVHRRAGLAILSPVTRVVLPLIGVAIGTLHKTCNANYDECNLGGTIVGGGIGVLTAMILDWSLGWEKSAVPPPVKRTSTGLALTAFGLAPSPTGVNLVLGGTF